MIQHRPSLGAQWVKNPPAMQETLVWSLGQEDPLEEGMAAHSTFLPGESHGQRNTVGCSRRESDTTELLSRTTHANAHSIFVCKIPKLETIQMSIHRWTDKQIMEYPHDVIYSPTKKNELLVHVTWMNLIILGRLKSSVRFFHWEKYHRHLTTWSGII